MKPTDGDLQAILQSIWSAVLGMPLRPMAAAPAAPEGPELTGCVQLTGWWEGAVILACPAALMRQAAARMFGSEPEQISDADMQDALAELTNIAAGNLKSLAAGPCQASLPTLVDGYRYRLTVLDSHVKADLAFESEGHPVRLRLLEKNAA
jgi:chemotaxis protein CheX